MDSSFSVTLVSNHNADYFAHNTSTSFGNVLPRAMDLGDYEVGLQHISFHDDRTEIKVEEKKNFFKVEDKQNEIIHVYVALDELGVLKSTDVFVNFIDNLRTALAHQNYKVDIIPKFKHGNIETLILKYEPSFGYELFLQDPLPRIFGFSQSTFVPGEYKNDLDFDEAYFKTLQDGYIGKLVKFKEERTIIELDQIVGTPDLEDLMTEIEISLLSKGLDAKFRTDPSTGVVEFDIKPEKTKVIFSSFLQSYLGLEENFAFIGQGSIKAPAKTVFPNKVEYPFEEPKYGSCSKVLVCCDLVSPQIFAGKEMPLLAVLERPKVLGPNFVSLDLRP